MTYRSSKSVRPVGATKSPKKTKKETLQYSGKRGIRPDHPRRPIEIPLGTVGGFPAVTISLKFHQHRLSGYRAVRGRNLADFGRSRYLRQPLIQQPFKIDKLKRVVASEVIAPGTSRPAEPHFTGLALNNLSCVTLDEVSKILTSIPAKSSPLDFIPTSLRKQ